MNIININDTSNKLFYIGGVVRDELLDKQSIDIDITYVGNAIEYCSKFGEVIQINPDFGTVRVKIPSSPHREIADFVPSTGSGHNVSEELNNVIVDFASTRSETYPKKGHLPVVEKIGCSLKEDVLRRDFTINALAKSITTGEIVDYVGGLKDLENKLKMANNHFTPKQLWNSYAILNPNSVRRSSTKEESDALTNIIQLVRFALHQIERLDSVVSTSKQYFNLWLGQNQREITDKQREVISHIVDYIASNGACTVKEIREDDATQAAQMIRAFGNMQKANEALQSLYTFVVLRKSA